MQAIANSLKELEEFEKKVSIGGGDADETTDCVEDDPECEVSPVGEEEPAAEEDDGTFKVDA